MTSPRRHAATHGQGNTCDIACLVPGHEDHAPSDLLGLAEADPIAQPILRSYLKAVTRLQQVLLALRNSSKQACEQTEI